MTAHLPGFYSHLIAPLFYSSAAADGEATIPFWPQAQPCWTGTPEGHRSSLRVLATHDPRQDYQYCSSATIAWLCDHLMVFHNDSNGYFCPRRLGSCFNSVQDGALVGSLASALKRTSLKNRGAFFNSSKVLLFDSCRRLQTIENLLVK